MKKTLVALAAVSAVSAFAQVSITGYFGGSYDNFAISNINAARTGAASENRVSDQSSRLIFNVSEDLGGGLTALGQYDLRFKVDAAARIQGETATSTFTGTSAANAAAAGTVATVNNPAVDPVTNGNIHVGLKSAAVGTLKLGRQDIYYTEAANYLPGGLFLAANPAPVVHSLNGVTMANWSRTPNLAWFESNRISGIQATVGYSTMPLRSSATSEVESNMGTTTNTGHGGGSYLKLNYANGPLDLTYAVISFKSGYAGGTAYATQTGAYGAALNGTNPDQDAQTIVAKYDLNNGLKVAASYHKNKATYVNAVAVAAQSAYAVGVPALSAGSQQTAAAWALSSIYTVGPNNFTVNYAKRGNLSYDGVAVDATGVKQLTLAYTYDLSKMTSVGVMYTTLNSGANTQTSMFYQGNNAYGGQTFAMSGETQKMTSIALRKNF